MIFLLAPTPAWGFGPCETKQSGALRASQYLPLTSEPEIRPLATTLPSFRVTFGVDESALAEAVALRHRAQFSQAADRLEQFAASAPGSPLAADALWDAWLIRVGLGETGRAEKLRARYEVAIGQSARGSVGEATDETIIDEARQGLAYWAESCPWQTDTGGCHAVEQGALPSLRAGLAWPCGRPSLRRPVPYPRIQSKARLALGHFGRVVKLWKQGSSSTTAASMEVIDAVSIALFHIAEAEYEDYLRLATPHDLEFTSEEWKRHAGSKKLRRELHEQEKLKCDSEKRFAQHYEALERRSRRLRESYAEVQGLGHPRWALAATARIGEIYLHWPELLGLWNVGQVVKEEVGNLWRCEPNPEAYSSTDRTFEAFEICVRLSQKHLISSEFTNICYRELALLDADNYPPQYEVWSMNPVTRTTMVSIGPVDLMLQSLVSASKRAVSRLHEESEAPSAGR